MVGERPAGTPDTLLGSLAQGEKRRSTIEVHPDFSEALHFRSSMYLTRKLTLAKIKFASR